jgi:hypothetical protein
MDTIEKFKQDGYVLVPNMASAELCDVTRRAYTLMYLSGVFDRDDHQSIGRISYANLVSESLLETFRPKIEAATGLSLFPTNSYSRIYVHGSKLARHTDREGCEISASLTIFRDELYPWPLMLENKEGEPVQSCLQVGEAVVYKGVERPHWREPFKGQAHIQIFFHYVDQNGPYAHLAFNERERLGPNSHDPNYQLPENEMVILSRLVKEDCILKKKIAPQYPELLPIPGRGR